MSSFLHPASLNEFQRYKQAAAILKQTNRATNPDWYRPAFALENQLHLRIDGASLLSFYHSTKENAWGAAPPLTEEILRDTAARDAWIADIIAQARASRAKSLGIVLHLADEFATAELKPEFSHHENPAELREAALHDPASILADASTPSDQASWRFIPYGGNSSTLVGTTISVSRAHADFLRAFRAAGEAENFPIVTQALSAPLIALKGVVSSLTPTPGKPFVAILQYPWLTAMAFFNSEANLVLIRSLQHRGLHRPNHFRQVLHTTSTALELIEPDLYLAALSASADPTLLGDLKMTYPDNRVEAIPLPNHPDIPAWAPEPVIATTPPSQSPENTPTPSRSFSHFNKEDWATQDFLPESRELAEVYPSRGEMKLLHAARWIRYALLLLTLLAFGWASFHVIQNIRKPAWWFKPAQAVELQQKTAKLNLEKQKTAYWENLLEDRSKAWIEMESLARLIPPDSGLQVRSYSYSAKPAITAGQPKTGLVREWRITGNARETALEYLNRLNSREGISAHFSEIAKLTGNEAYRPDVPTRSLVINIRTSENSSYVPPASDTLHSGDDHNYPFSFDMTITQRFEATDPIAINAAKAP
ncbi:MAG: hypothetical protein QM627_07275 [Luteolibacter sp.]